MLVGTSMGGTAPLENFTKINEIRITRGGQHTYFWQNVEESFKYKIPAIINLDSYKSERDRGWKSESETKTFTKNVVNKVLEISKKYGYTKAKLKDFIRFTFDNEPMEIYTVDSYIKALRWVREVLGRDFYLGAGNENMPLARQKNFYEALCTKARNDFDVLDIHMQQGFRSISEVKSNVNYYLDLKRKYNIKRMANTEAGYLDHTTPDGWFVLKEIMRVCEEILDLEALCVCAISWNFKYSIKLGFKLYGKIESPYWNELIHHIWGYEYLQKEKPIYVNVPSWCPTIDFTIVYNICDQYKVDPNLILAIGWHETHWGSLGAGKQGYYLGYGVFSNSPFYPYTKSRAIEVIGVAMQTEKACKMIQKSYKLPITEDWCISFAKNYWKPSNPVSWGKSVYAIYKNLSAGKQNTAPVPQGNPPAIIPDDWKTILTSVHSKIKEANDELLKFIQRG